MAATRGPSAHTWSWATHTPSGGDTRSPSTPPACVAGRYQLIELLGAGANGQVWRARDLLLDLDVAVKLVAAVSAHELRRARREAVALRWASLPGVVGLRDDGRIGDDWFLVMDLVKGVPFPGCRVPQPWSALAGPTRRLLEVLAGLHAASVVHRDLKPANVLVDPTTDDVVLVDLGLATGRPVEAARATGQFAGTPRYAAPEQILGQDMDGRTDLYAVGIMLYEALSGRAPHQGGDGALRMLARRLRRPSPPLASVAPDVPAAVADVVDTLLQRDPRSRPAGAWDALAALGGRLPAPLSGELPLPAGDSASEPELQALFHGPDHFLHLREDGARALWERTGGQLELVREELSGWLRAGLGVWEDGAVRITRSSIERLLRGERVGIDHPLAADELELALGLAFPDATAAAVAAALAADVGEVQARVDDLVARGRAWRLPDGHVGSRPLRGARDARTDALRRTLAAALPHRHPGRVRLLAEAGAGAQELALVARAVVGDPELAPGEGLVTVERALQVARVEQESALEADLLEHLAAQALRQESAQAVALALYEVQRLDDAGPRVEAAEELLRAADAAFVGDRERVQSHLADLLPFAIEGLEVWRIGFSWWHRRGRDSEEEWLDSLARWVDGHVDRAARRKGWLGDLRYRQGRFQEAAVLHQAAAVGKLDPGGRVSSAFNASAALLDGGRPEAAARLARSAAPLAASRRLARFEALLTWVCRASTSRTSVSLSPSLELATAAARIHRGTGAQVALGEAVIAWRGGDQAAAQALAAQALGVYGPETAPSACALATLVRLLSGDRPPSPEQARPLLELARGLSAAGIRLQVLGLLGRALADDDLLDEARRLHAEAFFEAPATPLELVDARCAAGLAAHKESTQ